MKKMFYLMPLISVLSNPTFALASQELKSPYFIDGVQCEGLGEGDVPKFFLPEDAVEPAKKAAAQQKCETTFKFFGVEKFAWLNQSDLEELSVKMNNSGYFKHVDISIRKSELKNHVYLHGKFDLLPNYNFTVEDSFKYYQKDQKKSASRTANVFRGEVASRSHSPVGNLAFGFVAEQSMAKDPISFVDSTDPSDPKLNASDEKSLTDKNSRDNEIYLKVNRKFARYFEMNTNVHFYDFFLRQQKDGKYRANTSVEMGLLYSDQIPYVGTAHIGPKVLAVAQYALTEDSNKVRDRWLFLPGVTVDYLYGSEFDSYIAVKADYFHSSVENHTIFDLDITLAKSFSSLYNTVVGLDILQRSIKNPVLPADDFFLPDRNWQYAGLNVAKSFRTSGGVHKVALKVGEESIHSSNGAYNKGSAAYGISYKTVTDNYTVDLNATYYPQRVY